MVTCSHTAAESIIVQLIIFTEDVLYRDIEQLHVLYYKINSRSWCSNYVDQ